MPLNYQLTELGARLVRAVRTAPLYRLYALDAKRPGLVRDVGGAKIEVRSVGDEPWRFGAFVAQIPAPLGIGTLELEDGESVKGFLCEAYAVRGLAEITRLGGWRAYRKPSGG